MKWNVVMLAAGLLTANVANAQGVKVKKAWDALDAISKKAAETIKTKCGVEIAVEYNKSTWTELADLEKSAKWCGDAAISVADLCADKDYKDGVAKQIKKVTCNNDPALKTKAEDDWGNKHVLKDGQFSISYNKDSGNLKAKAVEFLKKTL